MQVRERPARWASGMWITFPAGRGDQGDFAAPLGSHGPAGPAVPAAAAAAGVPRSPLPLSGRRRLSSKRLNPYRLVGRFQGGRRRPGVVVAQAVRHPPVGGRPAVAAVCVGKGQRKPGRSALPKLRQSGRLKRQRHSLPRPRRGSGPRDEVSPCQPSVVWALVTSL